MSIAGELRSLRQGNVSRQPLSAHKTWTASKSAPCSHLTCFCRGIPSRPIPTMISGLVSHHMLFPFPARNFLPRPVPLSTVSQETKRNWISPISCLCFVTSVNAEMVHLSPSRPTFTIWVEFPCAKVGAASVFALATVATPGLVIVVLLHPRSHHKRDEFHVVAPIWWPLLLIWYYNRMLCRLLTSHFVSVDNATRKVGTPEVRMPACHIYICIHRTFVIIVRINIPVLEHQLGDVVSADWPAGFNQHRRAFIFPETERELVVQVCVPPTPLSWRTNSNDAKRMPTKVGLLFRNLSARLLSVTQINICELHAYLTQSAFPWWVVTVTFISFKTFFCSTARNTNRLYTLVHGELTMTT